MTPTCRKPLTTTSSPATADDYWAMIRQGDYHLGLGRWNGGADPDTWLWSLFHDNHIYSQCEQLNGTRSIIAYEPIPAP